MGVAQGYGKIVTSGLVFAYDALDYRNSYKGAPGQNFAGGPYYGAGVNLTTFENNKIYRSNGYKETVFIPTIGFREVDSMEIYNEYDGYGTNGNYNCCPNIFSYTVNGWMGFPWLPNTTYTYQIIYKSQTGYTNPNYMYHYEYRADSSYITEYGVHTEGQRTHLGDGWYHAWNTFTTHPEANKGYCGMWHYEYYGRNKVSVAAVSIVPGTIIRPPLQFIDENTTRSSTESLYDLTGNATLSLANISFNSTGAMVFDGTDDYIDVPAASWNILTSHTLEGIFKANGAPASGFHVLFQKEGGYSGGAVYGLRATPNSQIYAMICYDNQAASQNTLGSSFAMQDNTWYHIIATFDSSYNWKLYINGVLQNQTTLTNNPYQNSSAITIGQGDGRKTNGELPVMKIYNRALTEAEVLQNYRHYKSRYNI